jgi:hypothetical protein
LFQISDSISTPKTQEGKKTHIELRVPTPAAAIERIRGDLETEKSTTSFACEKEERPRQEALANHRSGREMEWTERSDDDELAGNQRRDPRQHADDYEAPGRMAQVEPNRMRS